MANVGSGKFEQIAAPLAGELLTSLEQEHSREVLALYEEQVRLREELRRVVDIMQREVLPRERQLHDMFEKLNEAFTTSTTQLRRRQDEMHSHAQQASQQHERARRHLMSPLEETENELTRIQSMLAHPPVTSSDLSPQLVTQVNQQVAQSVHQGSGALRSSDPRSPTRGNNQPQRQQPQQQQQQQQPTRGMPMSPAYSSNGGAMSRR
ncbi:unnamed protein product [Polarella glacialis]|uniref:Uncharacterized protein n=1 Tax=Polarella glacialis TaxID=89957 RepID=A0A813JUW7_POLGL|nr:unnamed protein product [Polarella glacialis]